jgi:hypothetical protein
VNTTKDSLNYTLLSQHDKALFLAALAHDLTVAARDTYVPGTNAIVNPVRLRAFNELLHRIASHQRDILADAADRFPDDVFLEMLIAGLNEVQCAQLALNVLSRLSAAATQQTKPINTLAPRRSA